MINIAENKPAVYAGSFNPLTKGHLDSIRRAQAVFGNVVVAVANNIQKKSFFSAAERQDIIAEVIENHGLAVTVDSFDGLLVDYCKKVGASVIVRGLRAVSDYEYESQLAITNRQLDEDIETVFLMTSKDCSFISSRIVREIASFGGDVSTLVPEEVAARIENIKSAKS